MKNFLPKILFYYSAIAAFFITISLAFTSQAVGPFVFTVFFLPVAAYFVIEFFKHLRGGGDTLISLKRGESLTLLMVFLLLLGIGIRNVYKKSAVPAEAVPAPSPLIFKSDKSPSPEETISISISDGSAFVNIRQKPTVYSEKIGEAKDGETFGYTQKTGEWYEVELENGSYGYVSARYVKEPEEVDE